MSHCCNSTASTRVVVDSKSQSHTAEILNAKSSPVMAGFITDSNNVIGPGTVLRFKFTKVGNVVTAQSEGLIIGLAAASANFSYPIPEAYRHNTITLVYPMIGSVNGTVVTLALRVSSTDITISPLNLSTFTAGELIVVQPTSVSYIV